MLHVSAWTVLKTHFKYLPATLKTPNQRLELTDKSHSKTEDTWSAFGSDLKKKKGTENLRLFFPQVAQNQTCRVSSEHTLKICSPLLFWPENNRSIHVRFQEEHLPSIFPTLFLWSFLLNKTG